MIEAEDELDVFFGFGFCQGQDRAVQIELTKRAASGTLSELFGRTTLQVDRLFRRVGLRRAAEEQFQALSPRVASIITAFALGVNAGRTVGLPRRPHEFVLLRARPTEFTALDVIAILKLQSFAIPSNWDSELARLMVLNLDGPDALRDLDPAYPEWHRVAAPPSGVAGKAAERLAEDLAMFQETIGTGGGSNSWAVSGSRTRSGTPLACQRSPSRARRPAALVPGADAVAGLGCRRRCSSRNAGHSGGPQRELRLGRDRRAHRTTPTCSWSGSGPTVVQF